MEYYLKVFECWNNEKLEEEALEDQKIAQEIIDAIGVGDEEIVALEREGNELQMILDTEDHNQLLEECTKLNEICCNKEAKIHELEEEISQQLCFKNEAPNKLAQMKKTIEVDKALCTKYKTKMENSSKMWDEARNNNCIGLLRESEQAISQCSTQLETYEQMAHDCDIKLARLIRKGEVLQTNFNKVALAYSGSLPVLQTITQHGHFLLTEKDLQDIEETLKIWNTELKLETSQLENVLEEKQESMKAKEYKHRESEEWKALEAEMQDAEAEDLQMKLLKEQEEARLKSELRDIIQDSKTLVKDMSLIEKARSILHQKEEEVKLAKLHIEQVHQTCQDVIDTRVQLFDDFMKKVDAL